MRIVYVTDSLAICGGIERVLTDKMNYLTNDYGYDVVLMTLYQGPHKFPFVPTGGIEHFDINVRFNVQYEYRGLSRFYKRWKLEKQIIHRLTSAISELKPDVLVCVKYEYADLLCAIKGDIPLVVESHTLCNAEKIEKTSFFRKMHMCKVKRRIRSADVLVALTDGDANDWRRINQNVFVIPNVVYLNENTSFSTCNSKSIIFVGRLSKQKNISVLLDIWKKVNLANPDWVLHIYGEKGDIEDCVFDRLLMAKSIGIVIHEPVRKQMIEEYKKHSILVLTSIFEPFGLVLPEAMSCGLPIVSFDCPYGPADIITDGVDGFLIKNRDVNEFAGRVCQLIEDRELRVRMGQAAVKSAQRYRADLIMPKWKDLFERLCRKE
jgi:glycosyltransferase involved in cell wall biosynthesis